MHEDVVRPSMTAGFEREFKLLNEAKEEYGFDIEHTTLFTTDYSYIHISPLSSLSDLDRLSETWNHMIARDLLLPLLTDPDSSIRTWAALSLGYVGGSSAVEPLVGVLQDSSWRVVWNAISGLVVIGDPLAVPYIREVAESPTSGRGLQRHAAEAVAILETRG
jgi:HEAT repeat protein